MGFSIQASLVLDFGSSPTPWSLALSLGSETVTDAEVSGIGGVFETLV